MQLFISYVLNKVAPIHNPNTKVVNFLLNELLCRAKIRVLRLFHTLFVPLLALNAQNMLKINHVKQFPDNYLRHSTHQDTCLRPNTRNPPRLHFRLHFPH